MNGVKLLVADVPVNVLPVGEWLELTVLLVDHEVIAIDTGPAPPLQVPRIEL